MNLHKYNKKYFSFKNITSCLFVPGNQDKMLKKSINILSDIIVPDLEDSVPLNQKENAANIVKSYLKELNDAQHTIKRYIFPRVNSLSSGLFLKDLNNLINHKSIAQMQGLVIPKVSTVEQFKEIINSIKHIENNLNHQNQLKLIIWIESPLGIINLKDILEVDKNNKRLIGVAFGAEDYCNDLQIPRSYDNKSIETARCIFAMTVYAYGLIPFDTPYVEFRNQEGLIREINYVRSIGFKGKFAIHPNQVEIINKYFLPSNEEIEEAYVIIEAFEKALKEERASLSVNNKMVDYPVYKKALGIIERVKKL